MLCESVTKVFEVAFNIHADTCARAEACTRTYVHVTSGYPRYVRNYICTNPAFMVFATPRMTTAECNDSSNGIIAGKFPETRHACR